MFAQQNTLLLSQYREAQKTRNELDHQLGELAKTPVSSADLIRV